MISTDLRVLRSAFLLAATTATMQVAGATLAHSKPATYKGPAVHIGRGTAQTLVRTDRNGKLASIGLIFTPSILDGLPHATKGMDPDFPYLLPMPTKGPKTVVDHVVINWESAGHPPPHVYDVPHFDFHFYLVGEAEQKKVSFKSDAESADPSQQPPADVLPTGYVVPPGTAVSQMGVHAVNPSAPEFHNQPFTATFIYGYYNKQLTFLEPMASLTFLTSKPKFSALVTRPASYSKHGLYPSAYTIKYEPARKVYEVALMDFK